MSVQKKSPVKKKAAIKAKIKKKVSKKRGAPAKATSKKSTKKKTMPNSAASKKRAQSNGAVGKTGGANHLPTTASRRTGPLGKVTGITIRMYAHGFGDCFLLFFKSGDETVYKMVIDCGLLTGDNERLRTVIKNIAIDCDNYIDVVVQTHEHKDHVSGFNLKGEDDRLLWDSIHVSDTWFAWTENTGKGGDDLARQLNQKHEKKKMALVRAVAKYKEHITSPQHIETMQATYSGGAYYSAQQRYTDALQQLLEFSDVSESEVNRAMNAKEIGFGLTIKEAMAYFVDRNRKTGLPDISYWDPGELANEATTGLPGINFYFLGPPKNYDRLKQMDDNSHKEMYIADMGLSDNFYMALDGVQDDAQRSPFHSRYACNENYFTSEELKNPDNVSSLYTEKINYWREIDSDWLNNAGALALALDSYTNNTSLVIAIEFTDSKKVLMFVADAQIGNWISWTEKESPTSEEPKLKWTVNEGTNFRTVTADDLLQRTVFYKVGHHASHNATARAHGLELMMSPELAAMIPVDEFVAQKQGKKGWKMPAEDLYARLLEKTKGRVIRLDKGNLIKDDVKNIPDGFRPSEKQRVAFNQHVRESPLLIKGDDGSMRPLFWEYFVDGK